VNEQFYGGGVDGDTQSEATPERRADEDAGGERRP
jgi:hypothetical protein